MVSFIVLLILCFDFSCILHVHAIIIFELFWLDVYHLG